MILHYISQSFWGPRTKQTTSIIRQKATIIAWGTLYATCRNILFFCFLGLFFAYFWSHRGFKTSCSAREEVFSLPGNDVLTVAPSCHC